MSIYQKNVILGRPALSEMFAAAYGITIAGYASLGINAELSSLAGKSASLTFDAKYKANVNQPMSASSIMLGFLKEAREVLDRNQPVRLVSTKGVGGGTTKDILSHIEDMLVREAAFGQVPRIREVFEQGHKDPTGRAMVTYLPRAEKGNAERQQPVSAPTSTPTSKTRRRGPAPKVKTFNLDA